MNLSGMRLPRELEADGTAATVREVLTSRTVQLWNGSDVSVPMITMSNVLIRVLKVANSKGQIRCGFEVISKKLEGERKGIAHLREGRGLPTGERISRLLLISSDGAQRFYRHIEKLLQLHAPRLLCCILDLDGSSLGNLITGKEKQIKIIMMEHKDAVSALLRTLVEFRGDQKAQPSSE